MRAWALDLGTTNTVLGHWDDAAGQPRLLQLAAVRRPPGPHAELVAGELVPSAIEVLELRGWPARLTAWPPLQRRWLVGRHAIIGQPALERSQARARPGFATSFKRALLAAPRAPLVRCGERHLTAREVTQRFLRELLTEVKRTERRRIRELVVTTPVEAYEVYRAELQAILRALGVARVRFLDEPVAAALGYGIGLREPRRVLVVDFGGGTLDLALVSFSAREAHEGRCEIVAKAGRPLGGDVIDGWILEELAGRLGHPASELRAAPEFWRRLALAEACRVKEAVYFRPEERFFLPPPSEIAAVRASGETLALTRDGLAELLRVRGLHAALEGATVELMEAARAQGLEDGAVDDVLLVGGSTLLPGVYPLFEQRFGRHRVRAWQPFQAVVGGATAYAAGRFDSSDFIVHDYGLVTYDLETRRAEHTVIVPRGTRFPTAPDLWRRRMVPTCSLGEPERTFKLVICELGRGGGEADRRFVWDAGGEVHALGAAPRGGPVVVPLNELDPALGELDPPHQPGDKRPRLEVGFGVNAERWLVATVKDLRSGRELMRQQPVVKLL